VTRYLLDTNICIYISNRSPEIVGRRLERTGPGEVAMSVITYMELIFGAYKSSQTGRTLALIEELRQVAPVLPLHADSATQYGRIRTQLERRGTPIGPLDLLIAAHALSLGLTLVTSNEREFTHIPGLRVENWAV
jgi:tRNA(fMet)-specific endonuclease VapC